MKVPGTGTRVPGRNTTLLVLALSACLGDPVGPGALEVTVEGAGVDTEWVGAPGEAIPGGVRLRITDYAGRPLPAASLVWEVVGRNAQVLAPASQSNSEGVATAGWLLGTDAAEEQRLQVTVRTSGHQRQIVLQARAVPHVVSQLRLLVDTPAVLRVGDTLPVLVDATDPYGNPFPAPDVTISLADSDVGSVVGSYILGGPRRGQSVVRVASHEVQATFPLRVTQYVAAIVPTSDTIRFSSLGDELPVGYVVRDDRGRAIADTAATITVLDSAVVQVTDSIVRSRSPGVTALRLALDSMEATVVVEVRQIATTLTVAVTFGNPVVTLPVGAIFPLSCQAFDRNGFLIPRDPALVASVKGTVVGAVCGDLRVQRSGYDTLLFALGAAQARIPVIVATEPDSVGVIVAAQPLTDVEDIRYVGEDPSDPSILALRPLVQDILAAYGNPTTNLDRARAIRDWVARTAVYPDAAVHPDSSTSNSTVLPVGKTWAHVNSVLSLAKWGEDDTYWSQQFYDGHRMLDRLLGTLDPVTGKRADDGMMEHVAGARYRIRDIESYRYVLCTYQAILANALWAAVGLQGLRLSTLDHDPAAVFIPELGRWVYEDPTFSEEYILDGTADPLSPVDLLVLSTDGQAGRVQPRKLLGPSFDPEVYNEGRSYMRATYPEGMIIMGSQLYGRTVGAGGTWIGRYVQIDVPRLATVRAPYSDPLVYARVTAKDAFPTLGVVVSELLVEDSVFVIHLSSTLPNHEHFERRVNSGSWEPVAEVDVLPVGACRVEYRSVDAVGSISASAMLDVWVPRAQAFVQSGDPDSPRRQAKYCM
jgi:hypothetical protein